MRVPVGQSPAYIALKFRPNWTLVSMVRRFVSSFYEQILSDPDATSRVAMATHELVENAAKYSSDGETSLSVEVLDEDGAQAISIRTWNRAEPAHVNAAKALIDEINRAADPFAFYQGLMRSAAKKATGSGLGLARVRAEGEMSLRYELDGDRASIIAQTRVQLREGP